MTLCLKNVSMPEIDPKKHFEILGRYGLSWAEWATLSTISVGSLPKKALSETAAWHTEGDPRGSLSRLECEKAVSSCFANGWLQIVDSHVLDSLRVLIKNEAVLGPIYGFPNRGEVDFTLKGGKFFRQVHNKLFNRNWASDFLYRIIVPGREELYTRTKKGIRKAFEEIKERSDILSFSKPKKIGPWRIHWWDNYPRGYQIDFETVQETNGE